jgi:hypothetical protein
MKKLEPNPMVSPLNIGENATTTSLLLAVSSQVLPPEAPGEVSAWQEDDSSFFMPERCTPLDDF